MLQKLSARTQKEENRSALDEDGKTVDWENHTEYGGVMVFCQRCWNRCFGCSMWGHRYCVGEGIHVTSANAGKVCQFILLITNMRK
jgi:hypothetical protein